jgi:preprotein translocase subunit SecE
MLRNPAQVRRLSIARIRSYFADVIAELKKVVWPTRNETKRLTLLVIIVAGVVGIILGVADFSFTKLMELILNAGG